MIAAAKQAYGYHDWGGGGARNTFTALQARMREEIVGDLSRQFEAKNVTPDNKAIKIAGLTGSRAEVDVVPAFQLHFIDFIPDARRYSRTEGVAILGADGGWTWNFPDQHHANGVSKRARTGQQFKRIVRIFKRLRNELIEQRRLHANVPSFLVECLVYAVEDELFTFEQDDRYDRVRRVAVRMQQLLDLPEWTQSATEINGIKLLFHPLQPWTLGDAKLFARAVVNHFGST